MKNMNSLRWLLATTLAGAGVGFLAWGIWAGRPELSALGLGAWLALGAGLVWSVRQRAEVGMELGAATRFDLGQARQWQEAQAQLAAEGQRELRQLAEAVSSIREQIKANAHAQETLRQLVVDGSELTLRSYRDITARLVSQHEQQVREMQASMATLEAAGSQQAAMARNQLEALATLASSMREAIEQVAAQQAAESREFVAKALLDWDEQLAKRLRGVSRTLEQRMDSLGELLGGHPFKDQLQKVVDDVARQVNAEVVVNRKDARARIDGVGDRLQEAFKEQMLQLVDDVSRQVNAEVVVNRKDARTRLDGLGERLDEALSAIGKVPDEKLADAVVKRNVRWLKNETVVEVSAMLGLPHLLKPRQALPAQTGYSMEPSSILAVAEEILRRKPRQVLECGSGLSTIWLAYALEQLPGHAKMISLEHLQQYYDAGVEQIALHGLESIVDLRLAPLEEVSLDGSAYPWYAKSALSGIRKGIDLLLVDGPPKSTGPLARYPAVPMLVNKLSDHALIIVDDADRPDEKQTIARWREQFSGLGEPMKIGARTIAIEYRGK
ncbi:hypothetical protein GCM10011521_01090 [Arenimonas soli]|uniref:Class I SAM-dependent methyltransferase n=1 Tax=Arenimonas soli TaxID=2269504 RepID=A0ABQ1HAK3_9GAMM|nr:class I SAM-dependent methyltransferase [Arenimonas soli]GGA66725.1 hypothetical protein GCM10011521_01090 [Arenimonas soli]